MKNLLEFKIVETGRVYPFWWWDNIIPIIADDNLWNDAGVWVDEIIMFKN